MWASASIHRHLDLSVALHFVLENNDFQLNDSSWTVRENEGDEHPYASTAQTIRIGEKMKQSSEINERFFQALTLQAVLPIFPLLGVGVSLIGILGVASDPVLEIAPIIVIPNQKSKKKQHIFQLCELPAFISPLIVILHIRYYSE